MCLCTSFKRIYEYIYSDSRLSTPSFSSSDGKGKRPLSFSPMSDNLLSRSQQTMDIQRSDIPTIRVIIVFH
jgi:hypothetical protein